MLVIPGLTRNQEKILTFVRMTKREGYGKLGKIRENTGKYGKICEIMEKRGINSASPGEIREDTGDEGKIRENMGN